MSKTFKAITVAAATVAATALFAATGAQAGGYNTCGACGYHPAPQPARGGSLLNLNANVGGRGGLVDANVGVLNGGHNSSLANVNVNVGANNGRGGSLIDLNANVGQQGRNGSLLGVNANVGQNGRGGSLLGGLLGGVGF